MSSHSLNSALKCHTTANRPGNLGYRNLVIEEDPIAQGFEPESYDVVVAANVLQATTNLVNPMRNVRRLLKSGGKVIFSEVTAQLLSDAVIFGPLPGEYCYKNLHSAHVPYVKQRS